MSYVKPIKRERPRTPIRVPEPSVNIRPTFAIHKDSSSVNVKSTFPVRKDSSAVNAKTLFPVRKDPPSFVDAKAGFTVRTESSHVDPRTTAPVRKGSKVIHELVTKQGAHHFSYTPLNKTVYTAAYSGCISGFVGSSRNLQDTNSLDSVGFTQIAGAFASSFDIEWGSGAPDTLQVFMIEKTCKAVWENRNGNVNPNSLNTTSFTKLCRSIIALIVQSEAYFVTQGITPDAWPGGGGGGSGTVTSVTAGPGISVTGTPTIAPIVNNTGVLGVAAGTNVTVTGTAQNPIINTPDAGVIAVHAGTAISITGTSTDPIINNTAPAFPLGPNAAFAVSDWYIAPVTGDDSNDGLTAGTPLQHYAALAAKWGTTSPVNLSPTGVRIHFLEDFTDLNDPVSWTPIDPNGYGNTIIGTEQPVSSGVLAGVVPKNRAAGNGLSVDLGVAAAGSIGLLLTNITRSASSYVRSAGAGTVVNLDQPLDLASDGIEVDTYANGDSFTITQPTKVSNVTLTDIQIESAWLSGIGILSLCNIADSKLDGIFMSQSGIVNCRVTGGSQLTTVGIVGGSIESSRIVGSSNTVELDTVLTSVDLFVATGGNDFSQIIDYVLIENQLRVGGSLIQGFSSTPGAFYGTGTINVDGYGSTLQYATSTVNNGIAVDAFLGGLTLQVQGESIVSSWDTSVSPQVYVRGRVLSPIQLDTTIALGGLSGWGEDDNLTTGSKFLIGGLRSF